MYLVLQKLAFQLATSSQKNVINMCINFTAFYLLNTSDNSPSIRNNNKHCHNRVIISFCAGCTTTKTSPETVISVQSMRTLKCVLLPCLLSNVTAYRFYGNNTQFLVVKTSKVLRMFFVWASLYIIN